MQCWEMQIKGSNILFFFVFSYCNWKIKLCCSNVAIRHLHVILLISHASDIEFLSFECILSIDDELWTLYSIHMCASSMFSYEYNVYKHVLSVLSYEHLIFLYIFYIVVPFDESENLAFWVSWVSVMMFIHTFIRPF